MRASAPNAEISDKSIAVLPFIDLSEKHDQEYFADGMAEEILNLLARVPDLKVIGRTSSFQFKGKANDLRRVGAALGAVYVVEGSVRRSGDHLRVTAQLIDTRTGAHRWSEDYDRDARDAIAVQDEIAASLVRALQVEVVSLPARIRPNSSEAYDDYMRGLHAQDRRDLAKHAPTFSVRSMPIRSLRPLQNSLRAQARSKFRSGARSTSTSAT